MPEPRFVGRDEELASFEQMLQNPWGDSRLKFVWGPGGIGKTWLTKEMLKKAQKYPAPKHPDDVTQKEPKVYKVPERTRETKEGEANLEKEVTVIDMYATRNRYLEGVMESIIEHLGLANTLSKYPKEKERLLQARQETKYPVQSVEAHLSTLAAAFRQELSQFVRHQPVVLAFDTFEHVQDTAIGHWILDEQGLQMPGLLCLIAGRKPNPKKPEQPALGGLDEQQALNFYRRYFPPVWSDELSEQEEAYVRRLNNQVQGNPLLLGLALLWLDDNDLSEEDWQNLSVPEFERRIASWLSPSRINRQGTPFKRVGPDWQEPLRQTLVCVAYLNRRFTRSLLAQLIQTGYVQTPGASQAEAVTTLWQLLNNNLPEFFYIKERPEGEIQLHDKLAEMLRLNVLPNAFDDMTEQRVRQFATDVVGWYDTLIADATDNQQKAILQVEKLAYALRLDVLVDAQRPEWVDTPEAERLAHLLPPDYARGLALLEQYQSEHSDIQGRLIINELESGGIDDIVFKMAKRSPAPEEQYKVYALLGQLATDAYMRENASRYWDGATTVAAEGGKWTDQVEAMIHRHNNTWQRDLAKSITILKEARQLCEQHNVDNWHPTVLYELGFTYTELQDMEEAVQWYEQALKIAGQNKDRNILPTILNDMGYNYLLMGDYGQARANITQARDLRELNRNQFQQAIETIDEKLKIKPQDESLLTKKRQIEKDLRDAKQKIGMSYNTLGQLARYTGDIARANGYYAEALETFEEIDDYNWQAIARYSRGDAHRVLAMNLFNQGRISASERYENRAKEDLDESLRLIQQYGFVELEDLANRHMGRLVHDQALRSAGDPAEQVQLLQKARKYFEKGLRIALETDDLNEELENLTEMAFLTDDLVRAYKARKRGRSLNQPEKVEVESYIKRLDEGLEKHRQSGRQTYQFPVFENLLKIEKAAYAYELNKVEEAQELYLEGFTGLARDPGYGSARCRAHFDHLFRNIRRLPDTNEQVVWCEQFMERWRTTDMARGERKTLAAAHPDLYKRFENHTMTAFMYTKDEPTE